MLSDEAFKKSYEDMKSQADYTGYVAKAQKARVAQQKANRELAMAEQQRNQARGLVPDPVDTNTKPISQLASEYGQRPAPQGQAYPQARPQLAALAKPQQQPQGPSLAGLSQFMPRAAAQTPQSQSLAALAPKGQGGVRLKRQGVPLSTLPTGPRDEDKIIQEVDFSDNPMDITGRRPQEDIPQEEAVDDLNKLVGPETAQKLIAEATQAAEQSAQGLGLSVGPPSEAVTSILNELNADPQAQAQAAAGGKKTLTDRELAYQRLKLRELNEARGQFMRRDGGTGYRSAKADTGAFLRSTQNARPAQGARGLTSAQRSNLQFKLLGAADKSANKWLKTFNSSKNQELNSAAQIVSEVFSQGQYAEHVSRTPGVSQIDDAFNNRTGSKIIRTDYGISYKSFVAALTPIAKALGEYRVTDKDAERVAGAVDTFLLKFKNLYGKAVGQNRTHVPMTEIYDILPLLQGGLSYLLKQQVKDIKAFQSDSGGTSLIDAVSPGRSQKMLDAEGQKLMRSIEAFSRLSTSQANLRRTFSDSPDFRSLKIQKRTGDISVGKGQESSTGVLILDQMLRDSIVKRNVFGFSDEQKKRMLGKDSLGEASVRPSQFLKALRERGEQVSPVVRKLYNDKIAKLTELISRDNFSATMIRGASRKEFIDTMSALELMTRIKGK